MNRLLNDKIQRLIVKYDLNSLDVTSNPRELIIMLLSSIKNCSTADIKLDNVSVDEKDISILEDALKKIAINKIPPQYVTGVEYIYGNKFIVNENVLIPRFDTETLIEFGINEINKNGYTTLLDLCTGSGIVGINVALNTNIKQALLVDISADALGVTKKNIELNDVGNICHTFNSDMFKGLYNLNNKYDIILSNPPYLTKKEMGEISKFVEKEPSLALFGGKDGLDFYKIIFKEAKNFLNDGGLVAVEIGYLQSEDVINIILENKEYTDIQVIQDINGKNRVVACRFQKK